MTSSAVAAKGVVLTINGDPIAEIASIGDIGLDAETIDVTNNDSANNVKEFIGGLLDGGDVAVEGNLIVGDTAGQMAMWTALKSRTVQAFVMTFPVAITATWTFGAVVTSFKTKQPMKDQLGFTAKLKVSGLPVLAVGASVDATTIAIGTGTLTPAFDSDTYEYVVTETAVTATVTFTVTDATAAEITLYDDFNEALSTLTTGNASAAQQLGAAGSVTNFMINVKDAGKVPKEYKVHVARAAT
jgi:predicted secreted protein